MLRLRCDAELAATLHAACDSPTALPVQELTAPHKDMGSSRSPSRMAAVLRSQLQTALQADRALAQGVLPGELRQTCTACATTLLLEFGTLSRLTGDEKYEKAAVHAVGYSAARLCQPYDGILSHEHLPFSHCMRNSTRSWHSRGCMSTVLLLGPGRVQRFRVLLLSSCCAGSQVCCSRCTLHAAGQRTVS